MKINRFSTVNMKHNETRIEIKALKDEPENLQDAINSIEESMGDPLKLFIGEALICVDEDAATGYTEKISEEKQEQLLEEETARCTRQKRREIKSRMQWEYFRSFIRRSLVDENKIQAQSKTIFKLKKQNFRLKKL